MILMNMMMMAMISIDGNKGQTEQGAFEVSDKLLLIVDMSSHHYHHKHHHHYHHQYLYLTGLKIVYVFVLLYFQTGLST